MRYKAEVVYGKKVVASFFYKNLSHPNQVIRNVISSMRNKLNYFIVFIVNDIGEVWKYSIMKKSDGKLYVRKMGKENYVFNKDEIDLIFTNNMTMGGYEK